MLSGTAFFALCIMIILCCYPHIYISIDICVHCIAGNSILCSLYHDYLILLSIYIYLHRYMCMHYIARHSIFSSLYHDYLILLSTYIYIYLHRYMCVCIILPGTAFLALCVVTQLIVSHLMLKLIT